MKNNKSYEIDLGNICVRVYVIWENVRRSPYSFYDCDLIETDHYYIVSVDYNERVFAGHGKTETEALQNLTTKIKLAKELV